MTEQPYQQTMAEQWDDLAAKSLANFEFLMAKAKADMCEDIQSDYRTAFAKWPQELKTTLQVWEAFFREKAHILRRGNDDWPAHKILLQLAIEHADDSPLTIGAEKYLADDKCDWSWLRRENRTKSSSKLCLVVYEGHKDNVNGALILSDTRILSWCDDWTLRLWDMESGQCLMAFEGHTSC